MIAFTAIFDRAEVKTLGDDPSYWWEPKGEGRWLNA